MASSHVLSQVHLGPEGNSLEVTALGYGAMSLAGVYGGITEHEALNLLHDLSDRGVTFLDTANIYGAGISEETLGKFLKGCRHDFVLASKVGIEQSGGIGQRKARGDAAYIKAQIDESLQRLGTDFLDLYYLHRVDPDTPIEESVGALSQLVADGKVRRIGLSEATAEEIRRAHDVHPITAVQSEWSVFARDVEKYVVPAVAQLGIGFVPYSPVGRGILTDRFSARGLDAADARKNFPWFSDENLAHNDAIAKKVRSVAGGLGIATAGLSIAWLQAQARRLGVTVAPIPGTRSTGHWDELQAGVDFELPEAAMEALEPLAAQVHGERSFDPLWVSGGREGLIPR